MAGLTSDFSNSNLGVANGESETDRWNRIDFPSETGQASKSQGTNESHLTTIRFCNRDRQFEQVLIEPFFLALSLSLSFSPSIRSVSRNRDRDGMGLPYDFLPYQHPELKKQGKDRDRLRKQIEKKEGAIHWTIDVSDQIRSDQTRPDVIQTFSVGFSHWKKNPYPVSQPHTLQIRLDSIGLYKVN